MRGYPVAVADQEPVVGLLAPGERSPPSAELLRDRLLTLPTHSMVSARDVAALERWLRQRA
jgi:hypothetical protein